MIDLNEIEMEIERLESEDVTYQNLSRLAVLYSIKDHSIQDRKIAEHSIGSSEFLTAIYNAPLDEALMILDEHLDAVQILYPKEYSAIIQKIKKL